MCTKVQCILTPNSNQKQKTNTSEDSTGQDYLQMVFQYSLCLCPINRDIHTDKEKEEIESTKGERAREKVVS